MGMGFEVIKFLQKSVSATIGELKGKRLVELGDQKLHACVRRTKDGGRVWAKDYFEELGCHHYSIDWHGKNGAYPIDLSKPIRDPFWIGRFDILTNFGTAEHVQNQYECWRNIHNLVKEGGLFIHVVPWINHYPRSHCEFFYDGSFFEKLAKQNGYKIIFSKPAKSIGHWCCSLVKSEKKINFMVNDENILSF
jgi:hypothetical protein